VPHDIGYNFIGNISSAVQIFKVTVQEISNYVQKPHFWNFSSSFVASRRRRRCVHEFATTADGFGDVNAAVGRDQVYNSAANAVEVGYDVTYDAACL